MPFGNAPAKKSMPSPGNHRGIPVARPLGSAAKITRRAFLGTAALAAAGVTAYSGTHARHELEIIQREVPIQDLPDAFDGFRIVQISDLHYAEYTETWFLEKVISEVNALNADLVLITGDFISRGPLSNRYAYRKAGVCAELLSTLTAPERYGCLGNHDVGVGAGHVIDPLEANGTPILVDSYRAIERGDARIWLAGTDDAGTRTPDLDLAIPNYPDAPVILMAHEPDFVDRIIQHPRFPMIDMTLSGHTHGGQIRLPFVGPLILPPLGQKYVHGEFQFGHMQLYVNRGIGAVGVPFRLNCPSEISIHILRRATT
ncbi:MAG: metallophosphoesterase [Acidobacteriaceae bacterium]|nr:metallophosphoesterase [Acidobacteriaceae bacterium]